MLTALRNRRLRPLLIALAVSQAGDWLYNLALLACVQQRTHSAAWVGLTTAARVLPIVVAGPLGGVVADRFDRRRAMIASDVVRMGLMGLLALVAATGLPVLLLPLLAAAATAAGAAYPACVAASTPRLVAEDELAAANAARSAIQQACIVAGPGLGAVLLLLGPASVAFAANAVTFALAAVLVAAIPAGPAFAPEPGDGGERPRVLADVRAGAVALRAHPAALALVGADVLCSLAYGAQTVLLLLVAARLDLGAQAYGYLLAAFGAGGLIGATIAGRLGDARPQPVVVAGLLAVAVTLPGIALAGALVPALALAVVGGAGAVVVEVLGDTGLQRVLPREVLGRAYGLALPASLGAIVAGALVAPVLAALLGLVGALAALGAVAAAYAAGLAWSASSRPSRWANPAASTLVRASSLAKIRET